MANSIAHDLVASFDALFGGHAGVRAAHAKGTCCDATFTATPDAAALSRAPHLSGTTSPAIVRFSNGSGDPAAKDNGREPRGMSVKFQLPDGSSTDIVAINHSVFVVRTPEEFMEFMNARLPDPATGKPDVAKLIAFIQAHPEGQRAAELLMSTPPMASFLRTTYHAVHAFILVDATGNQQVIRYRWEPDLGEASLSIDEARAKSRDYLREELIERLGEGPAGFTLHLQLADPSDDPDDPTVEWPAERRDVIAGRLTITGIRPQGCEEDVFDPARSCDGIKLTKDKILRARSRAYRISSERRLA
jgi:catalase